ncbi:zinc finger and BTB domain-containing protein 17-like isoform X1 [Anoplophora glabripennis]|uniref:zinc finger and BTB domain-containing protein 17-like isoform X1 n=1 Tax=Anoplophora glabripennis TaxID=217634 RepID=UPI000873D608|nr:zinc finger and BTB domain-containing protein 17-like isoform X1 [Anoplophora glabripennis]XP_018573678.1 zinc finger and BTB domain-containing protein 17-like isoform X1 [Anoplophora glabripennis]
MEGEQFSLCWNNFHSNLSSGFHSLLKDEDLVDVTLAAEGKFLKAHKTVLSVCSPFFKELFRVNPCKHPIVILPDVNYGALCSLLHFMYQGEVSVSQEEIPTFMRVAETLKVKGLTDNNSSPSDTNGFTSGNRPYGFPDQRQIMKRPRPVKKIIRPIQHLRPIESPKLVKSPQPQPVPQTPPAKKPHVESEMPPTPPAAPQNKPEFQEPFVKPKQEPLDPGDDENTSHSGPEEPHMDISHMLDTTLGEPSPSQPFPNWPTPDFPKSLPQDTSSPGTLQCILGRRGNPRLIVDGYVFYKKSVYKGKAFWYCKNSRTPEKCQAVCWTMNGNIVKWPYMHSHPVIPDIFNPEEDTEVPIENLQEVLWQTSLS